MTQYVKLFPLPDPKTGVAMEMITIVKKICKTILSAQSDGLATGLEELVLKTFELA